MQYIPASAFAGGPPKAPGTQLITISDFLGADLTSRPTSMSAARSPDCRNMTRAAPGKVKRRPGYVPVTDFEYDGRINGASTIRDDKREWRLVHAGTKIYLDGMVVAGSRQEAEDTYNAGKPVEDTGVADLRSVILKMGTANRTVILDGEHIRSLYYTDHLTNADRIYHCSRLSDAPYVPTVMIDRDPVGGGTAYEDINVLSDAFTETFFADGESTAYQMSFDGLMASAGTVVKILSPEDGVTWTTLTEGTDYSVNYTTGVVTFVTAPAMPENDGASNVSITVSKDRSEKRAWIDKCTVAIVFGDNSTGARLFCTGNPDHPNRDFWSELNDPTYFSDINYSVLGGSDSAIVGYSTIGSYLAAHKDDGTIYVRSAVTDENDMYRQMFPIASVIRGPRSMAPRSFATLNNEPLFLTENGVYAITSSDLAAEKYAQRRSLYLDGALLKEYRPSEAQALVFKEDYLLSLNGRVYVLDGTTLTYAKDEPHSTYQYEGFLWTGIPARCMWIWDDDLYFGTDAGEVFRFSESAYTDNGQPFEACWKTPSVQGGVFYKHKRFTKIALQLAPGSDTSVDMTINHSAGTDRKSALLVGSDQLRCLTRRLAANKSTFIEVTVSCKEAQPFEPDIIAIEYIQSGRDDKRL